mgnify:CR=1 FL=1
MDIMPVLATIILVSIVVTIVLAIGTFMALRLRESRRPRPPAQVAKPKFFRRYYLRGKVEGSHESRGE